MRGAVSVTRERAELRDPRLELRERRAILVRLIARAQIGGGDRADLGSGLW
jgi:hypothetical protein